MYLLALHYYSTYHPSSRQAKLIAKYKHKHVPVHPLPSGRALPSPLKPDGHVQVKLPGGVFTQVAPVTQTAVSMVHSSMSEEVR